MVYSTVLDSVTGPFEFNWVGLYSSVNNTLVAINHIPTTPKTVTADGVAGNTLNRNFGIEYSGIADLTGIDVAPETWQLDFTARLQGMDKLTQQLAADMNGKDWFIGDGFKVEPRETANTFRILPGVGYVSGLRVELENEHIFTVESYPQFVYVDAWFEGNANSEWSPSISFTLSDTEIDDYTDVSGIKHYVNKLAEVTAFDTVLDLRPDSESASKEFATTTAETKATERQNELIGLKTIEGFEEELVGLDLAQTELIRLKKDNSIAKLYGLPFYVEGQFISIDESTMTVFTSLGSFGLYKYRDASSIKKLSSWMPGDFFNATDCRPYLRRAYENNLDTIVDSIGGMWNMKLIKTASISYPHGIEMNIPGHGITFERGAKMTMETVVGGRYSMFVANAADNYIDYPHLTGDKESHLPDQTAETGKDEQGSGIRVDTGAKNFRISDPTTNKMWGDGILWVCEDSGGYIKGRHYAFDCRRQGISVIKQGGLKIESTVGEEIGVINGAENGPWATIDIEPDHASQNIKGLEIGTIEGINNKGPACLLALLKLNETSDDIDLKIGNIISKGCLRAFEPRVDYGVKGSISIDYIHGTDSFQQDFQTVMFSDSVSLTVDKMISVNCNRKGDTASAYATPVGIYKNYDRTAKVGGIRIKSLTVINDETFLQHPVSIVNNEDIPTDENYNSMFGTIQIDEINSSQANFNNGSVHNKANAIFKTNSRIRKSFSVSASLNNNEWINTINNTGAENTVLVTVPENYGYEGMLFEVEHTGAPELRVKFIDKLERSLTDLRSHDVGDKAIIRRISGQWSIESVPSGQWSQGGYGYFGYGLTAGGNTANRPTDPLPWMQYSDVTIGKSITWSPVLNNWVLSSDLNQVI